MDDDEDDEEEDEWEGESVMTVKFGGREGEGRREVVGREGDDEEEEEDEEEDGNLVSIQHRIK
jgi:hypothetical protein